MKTFAVGILTFSLDRVKQRLRALGLTDMTLSEDLSASRSHVTEPAVSASEFLPRIQVRVVAPDDVADRVEEILRDAA
jgi:nitrogen regulatory protein PII